MHVPITFLCIAVLAAFTLSILLVFHMPQGRWVEGIGLAFGGLGSVGLFYLVVLLTDGPHSPEASSSGAGRWMVVVTEDGMRSPLR